MSQRLAKRIVEVPERYESGNESTAALLRQTGYLETPEALTVKEVERALEEEPRLAQKWLDRGSDQRLVGGWGIEHDDNGQYRVQNYADGKCLKDRNLFHACAEFIIRYIGFISDAVRNNARHS